MNIRNPAIDNARAIGIVLVVIGHLLAGGTFLVNAIYAFHMPLFFFLAGYVFNLKSLTQPKAEFARHYAVRLLIPYAVFGLLTYIPWVAVFRHFGASAGVPWYKPLVGMVYGVGTDKFLQHNPPLWFLPCLFMAFMMLRQFPQVINNKLLASFVAILAGVVLSLSPVRLPWSIDTALIALPFMLAGMAMKQHNLLASPKLNWAALAALPVFLLLVHFNFRADMNSMLFGRYGIAAFFPAAFAGILMTMAIARALPATRLALLLSMGTLWIFPLHNSLFTLTKGAGLGLLHLKPEVWQDTAYGIALLTVVGVVVPLVAQAVFENRSAILRRIGVGGRAV